MTKKSNMIFALFFLIGVSAFGAPSEAHAIRYMHKSRDVNANVHQIDSKEIVEAVQAKHPEFVEANTFRNPARRANISSIYSLKGGQSLQIPVSLLSREDLRTALGKILRLHIWIRGENVGTDADLWHGAPCVSVMLKDDAENYVSKAESKFKTRGTYPWHCYYIDIMVPSGMELSAGMTIQDGGMDAIDETWSGEDGIKLFSSETEGYDLDLDLSLEEESKTTKDGLPLGCGLFVKLTNPSSGVASFAGLSWEVLPKRSVIAADSSMGSRAPNPRYDELPMHVYYGVENPVEMRWNFLEGNSTYGSLTTVNGLKEFLQKSTNDWFAMAYGVAFLNELKQSAEGAYLQMYEKAKAEAEEEARRKMRTTVKEIQLPVEPIVFEDGWISALSEFIQGCQDENTGLWLIDGRPDILISSRLVERLLSPYAYHRAGEALVPTPANCLEGAKLQYAEAIIDSLLDSRLGNDETGYFWNQYVFSANEKVGLEQRTEKCHLITTAAAASLLRRAVEGLEQNSEFVQDAVLSINSALYHVMNSMVRYDGSVIMDSSEALPSRPDGFFELTEASYIFENIFNPNLMPPTIFGSVVQHGAALNLILEDFPSEYQSIRIFEVPADESAKKMKLKQLAGVIQHRGRQLSQQDPILAVRKITARTAAVWKDYTEAERQICRYTFYSLDKLPPADHFRVIQYNDSEFVLDLPSHSKRAAASAKPKNSEDSEDEDSEENSEEDEEDVADTEKEAEEDTYTTGYVYYAVAVDKFGRCSSPVRIMPYGTVLNNDSAGVSGGEDEFDALDEVYDENMDDDETDDLEATTEDEEIEDEEIEDEEIEDEEA